MEIKIQIKDDWTVDDTLKNDPRASNVFFRERMHCPGCYMQKFCAIKDVAAIYQVDLAKLLSDLNNPETAGKNMSRR